MDDQEARRIRQSLIGNGGRRKQQKPATSDLGGRLGALCLLLLGLALTGLIIFGVLGLLWFGVTQLF